MLCRLAPVLAATFIFGAASQTYGASSGEFGSGDLNHRLHSGSLGRSGQAGRLGSRGSRLDGYGMSRRFGTTGYGSYPGHESGWYHRGFGGTLGPGWGYGFGANLGGH